MNRKKLIELQEDGTLDEALLSCREIPKRKELIKVIEEYAVRYNPVAIQEYHDRLEAQL